MEKTTFEFIQMDRDLPMKILYFSEKNPLLLSRIEEMNANNSLVHFVPIHWHKEIEITFVRKGNIVLRKNNVTKEYQDGTFFIVNSGEIHELNGNFTKGFEVICLIISYDFIKQFLPNVDNYYFNLEEPVSTYDPLAELFTSILTTFQKNDAFSSLKIQSDLLRIFHLLCCYHLEEKSREKMNAHSSDQLDKEILDYIHCHYAEKLSLDDLADHFNFSKEYFARIFKEKFGYTFLNYLTDYRLYRAFPEIIKGNKTIEWISQQHGFPSSKALIRHFKKVYSDTPIQYRKKNDVQIMDHNVKR
ncbi:AraC family transcriptional regulator [Listeria costaricensis]|uniref:AraC family transcriptional regulator n=1 Tax=Listeria costaricensis TaxID=2026604 RepID=UPI000C0866E1|nr:AraC family transcriptional regulator [Listeria costaricensis]